MAGEVIATLEGGITIATVPQDDGGCLTVRMARKSLTDTQLLAMLAPDGWFRRVLEPWARKRKEGRASATDGMAASGKPWSQPAASWAAGEEARPQAAGPAVASSEATAAQTQGRAPPLIFELQENDLSDASVTALCSYLSASAVQGVFRVAGLKLFKNRVGDAGARAVAALLTELHQSAANVEGYEPMRELHLSHNFISDAGATELLQAITRVYQAARRPLWLRIEWNEVSPALFAAFFRSVAAEFQRGAATPVPSLCNASVRSKDGAILKVCNVSHCSKFPGDKPGVKVVVHAYAAMYQYSPYTASSLWARLTAESKSATLASDQSAVTMQAHKGVVTASAVQPSASVMQPQPASEPSGAAGAAAAGSKRPLILFLDTCSVVRMIGLNGAGPMHGRRPFTWDQLVQRALPGPNATFGTAGIKDPSERVYLIFTNTVMRELDSQSQKRGYAFAQLIRNQFRMNDPENSLLAQCQRLGFVEMLGVVQQSNAPMSNDFINTQNDSKILSTAESWAKQLKGRADVVFVTDDAALAERARRFTCVPTTSVKSLNSVLPEDMKAPWTATLFRECLERLGVKLSGNDKDRPHFIESLANAPAPASASPAPSAVEALRLLPLLCTALGEAVELLAAAPQPEQTEVRQRRQDKLAQWRALLAQASAAAAAAPAPGVSPLQQPHEAAEDIFAEVASAASTPSAAAAAATGAEASPEAEHAGETEEEEEEEAGPEERNASVPVLSEDQLEAGAVLDEDEEGDSYPASFELEADRKEEDELDAGVAALLLSSDGNAPEVLAIHDEEDDAAEFGQVEDE